MNVMRAGPQLGVAKAARPPPCTLPILAQAPTLRLSNGAASSPLRSPFKVVADALFSHR